ncbi:MAG: double-stranded uracil-DNA glycosylase [Dehalococcoidia bacterium]|nr:double-stranded uracil-DNA glycosylase [Dehalococcoidia bacterium]
METLPDYLQQGLRIIFVGINPGLYSAQRGHYFSTTRNRFWMAFNAAEMTPVPLEPDTDSECLRYGIGLTDVVKRPTRSMSELRPYEFSEGAVVLQEKLLQYQPLFACFNGISGYKNYLRRVNPGQREVRLGLQALTIGDTRVYVLPSTSPANAAVPLERIVLGMRELKRLVAETKAGDS